MPDDVTLITGATGFVGGRLLAACREDGEVRVLVRDSSRIDGDGIDVVEGYALEPVFGVTPTPFRDAARDALDELQGAAAA